MENPRCHLESHPRLQRPAGLNRRVQGSAVLERAGSLDSAVSEVPHIISERNIHISNMLGWSA